MLGTATTERRAGSSRALRVARMGLERGRLGGLLTLGERTTVVLADDVPGPDVAGALRHLLERHEGPDGGVTACRQPYCDGAGEWRPAEGCAKAASGT